MKLNTTHLDIIYILSDTIFDPTLDHKLTRDAIQFAVNTLRDLEGSRRVGDRVIYQTLVRMEEAEIVYQEDNEYRLDRGVHDVLDYGAFLVDQYYRQANAVSGATRQLSRVA